jgi:rare lipoprotein A
MSRLGNGRHPAAFGLLIGGALALFGAQQLAGTVAVAESVAITTDVHAFQPLADLPAAASMHTAVSTGQFEELFRPTPVPTIAPTPVPTVATTPVPSIVPEPALYETGIASTYGEGDGFEGNLTACGQVFRTDVVQVAHKSLPCGTVIRIEDTDTGMSVVAEVTDRGPYIRGRIVDLSWGAFQQLDATGPGLLNVNVYLLDQ